MQNILVVGGAGYIGSHMCKYLSRNGYQPIVLDNLVRGHGQAVKYGPFIRGSLSDKDILNQVFSEYAISAVMHFAAFAYVGESVEHPARYYQNNVTETLHLLEAMITADIRRFIFSSSCAVYGEPEETPISETHPLNPINPYGRSKLMVEQILNDFHGAYGIAYVSLRYFNAAGADPAGELGEDHRPETHLIPLVLKVALGQQDDIRIFGDDYATKDGTCVRDYIHIEDLARAHLLSLERLLSNKEGGVYNLGNEAGYSVREVVEIARKVTGKPIPVKICPRRPGDCSVLVGSGLKARSELGWHPQYPDLYTIIDTAWAWHQNHPNGYPRLKA